MKNLKLSALVTIISLSSVQLAHAESIRSKKEALKGGASFTAGAVIGAAAGGPVGMFIGALGGGLLADRSIKSEQEKAEIHHTLEEKEMSLAQLESELNQQSNHITELEKLVESRMNLSLYFETGKDTLAAGDIDRVETLADFLHDIDDMYVNISGHTDIRGSDEYNNVLSKERAYAVADLLSDSGIDSSRITANGLGSRFAKTTDVSASEIDRAQDRKVSIELFTSNKNAALSKF